MEALRVADITDIVVHLSTGRSIAWVGAGPSMELGIPGWKDLANRVLETCRKQQKPNFSLIESTYREGMYPEMFDQVARIYGRDYLLNACEPHMVDPGLIGSSYLGRRVIGIDQRVQGV